MSAIQELFWGQRVSSTSPLDLSAKELDTLWAFSSRFVSRQREEFEETLMSCERLLRIERRGELKGMLATRSGRFDLGDRRVSVLYTQWLHLDPELRGKAWATLGIAGVALALWLRAPWRAVHVVFGAATWRSYLAVAKAPTPCWPRRHSELKSGHRIADAAMRRFAPKRWDSKKGLLLGEHTWRYREGRVDVPNHDHRVTEDPDIAYFAARNPSQAEGDCLVCVALVTPQAVALNLFRRGVAYLRGRSKAFGLLTKGEVRKPPANPIPHRAR